MSSIYCSQCGSKHSIGAKFCSSCGSALSSFAAAQQKTHNVSRPTRLEREHDEDGLPTTFNRPTKLSYEIDTGSNNKYRAEDIFNSPPVQEQDKRQIKLNNYKQLSREEFLAQSLKECAPRGVQDIDE